MSDFYYKVSPKSPVFKNYTYRSKQELPLGQRVKVPFRNTKINGVIMAKESKKKFSHPVKEIAEVDHNSLPLQKGRRQWLKWISEYYHYPLGLVLDLSFLSGSFKKKSLPEAPHVNPAFFLDPTHPSRHARESEQGLLKLNTEQELCVKKIFAQKNFQVHLIHGVTGSGKTEVYTHLIARALNRGQQALVLLPEIFLSPQIVHRLSKNFPNQTALLHSQVNRAKKKQEWLALLSQQKNLLVGTRSALFCPLPKLGLIIVDEEHDSSFKQEDKLRYQARDSAIVLAKQLNIPIVLGSATPDFASYQKAQTGSYQLHELKTRALKQEMPKMTLIDLKEVSSSSSLFWLSDSLLEKMDQTLKQGLQVALFLNRRGQAGSLLCAACGHVHKCLNCDISLTIHKQSYLICHYCSYTEQKPIRCPQCGSDHFLEKGLGTQKVEEEMNRLFPNYKTLRIDRDNVPSVKEMTAFIKKIESKEVQILIGTQMLAKGLNFPSIYLVGLLLADMDFHFPDFRAEERSFQTLLQMAGRAGRSGFGEVFLQSFNPQNSNFLCAKNHDYPGFFEKNIKSRKTWFYPPFSRLCLLKIDSLKETECRLFAEKLSQLCKQLAEDPHSRGHTGIQVLGPSPAPLFKIKNRYRFQILIKAPTALLLDQFLKQFFTKVPKSKKFQLKVDRDPSSMM